MIPTGSKQQRFYGWTALAGAMLVYFSMCGNVVYSFGVFLPVMCEEFGWSRTALSGTLTAEAIAGGILGPLVGISISKFGARKNIIAGNLVAALGLLGMSQVNEIWQVYLFFGVLAGGGIAFGVSIATTTMVNDWFIRRRSLAMSLLFTAGGIGGFAFPPLISWFIYSLGWQLGWVFLAGIHILLAVVIGSLLVRNKPEEMGQVPDGEVTQAAQEVAASSPPLRRVYQTPVDWTVKAALRTPALWLLLVSNVTMWFSLSILTIHQVAYLQDLGFSPMTAATALGLMVGMSIIGRLVCGVLGTRFEGRYLVAACLALMAAGISVLMTVNSLPFIYLYTTLCGIGYGGILVLVPVILGAYFGRAHYARIFGWTAPIMAVFGAGSPLVAGFIYDTTGSYTPAFWIALALLGVGMVCALLARPPKPPVTMSC